MSQFVYSSELKMDYVVLIYSDEFGRQILTYHALIFDGTQRMMAWRILFSYL